MSAKFKKIGDFEKAVKILHSMPDRIEEVAKNAFGAMGAFYAGEIIKGLDSQAPAGQAFEPLSARTIEARAERRGIGSTKALIDTGSLRGSITHKLMRRPIGVFVGGLATAMHPITKEPTANLIQIHEEGIGRHLPARPFIGPIMRSRSIYRRAVRVFANQIRFQQNRLMR